MTLQAQREAAIEAVRKASLLCRSVQAEWAGSGDQLLQQDRSPVTVADFGAQAVVSLTLRGRFPEIPIVGEETAEALRGEGGGELRERVIRAVRAVGLDASAAEILDAIDSCADGGGPQGQRWVLDPIDGTKGYLRKQQYAVALALLDQGDVVLGVLGCPALPRLGNGGAPGCLFVAARDAGSVEIGLDPESETATLAVGAIADPAEAAFCESVEAAHSAHDRHSRIAEHLGVRAEPVRIDSQCKYGVVARGEAAIYLRLPRSESYREKIWDHAAGWLVVTEAGGRVSDTDGRPLDFSIGRTLDRNRGIVATNGALHDPVLAAIRATAAS